MSQKVNFKRILFTTQNTPFDTRAVPITSLVPKAVNNSKFVRIISDFDRKLSRSILYRGVPVIKALLVPSAKRGEASDRLYESNKVCLSAERTWAQFASVQRTLHSCRLLMTPRSSRFDLIWAGQTHRHYFPTKTHL